ncbi:aminoglycoside/choline kinase family phosphotransferase [Methylohalomonas lacus]|uniref:Aminoglycoside/choline kinase family phosphotransferase n=2 Tax=Methylohalomonas lacus TaxID=398773 RepID=A0AAE3HN12_9GAMM|nr:aminoglycoside/choline kinase family phosphotransferase [Methylohalomonas lacus]
MATPQSTAATDPRLAALHDWLAPRFGIVTLEPASSDASFRRYFRFHQGGRSYVVMDAPPEHEDCRPFVDIAARLQRAGLHVPGILAADLERGFLLLGDLGTTVYLAVLNEANADALFADAIAALVTMQADADASGLPAYDRALLLRELNLFVDWYLGRHLQIELDAAEAADLAAVFEALITRAQAQAQVFVHRDYMPRNLMVSQPNPGVLDFQDAVVGPVSYDPVCLFRDAFISWPAARVSDWLHEYWQQGRARGVPLPPRFADFQVDVDWMGVQRHLKVLGIFARIRHRDGKPQYLEDAPRFFEYILQVAPRYPELAPLAALFAKRILPAVH